MRLVIAMNLSPTWVDDLHRVGHDALHWSTVGEADAADRDVMQWARHHDRVVLRNDLDFSAILVATGGEKRSVVQIRGELLTPSAMGRTICAALACPPAAGTRSGSDPHPRWRKTQVRILPLGSRLSAAAWQVMDRRP